MNYAVAVIALAIMVILTNIIVQVIKDFSGLKDKPTKIVTTVVAVALSVIATVAYCEIFAITLVWYIIVASVIVGFIVAYGAMFGFDNLYGELLDKIKDLMSTSK